MIGRGGSEPKSPLVHGERFVDHDDVKERARQPRLCEVGAPCANDESVGTGAGDGAADRIQLRVDSERTKPGPCQQERVPASAHGEIDSSRPRDAGEPLDDEGRRWIAYDRVLAQALLTAVGIGLLGLVSAAVLGLRGTDVGRHISFGFFSTLVTLLAHSMMMFYLIGKGKAVKDAMAEGGLTGDHYRRIAMIRKPVFSVGTLAMSVTMVAAILGASVDTGVLPPIVHAMIAYGAIVCNVAALRVEISALAESSRIVDEVNHLLGS